MDIYIITEEKKNGRYYEYRPIAAYSNYKAAKHHFRLEKLKHKLTRNEWERVAIKKKCVPKSPAVYLSRYDDCINGHHIVLEKVTTQKTKDAIELRVRDSLEFGGWVDVLMVLFTIGVIVTAKICEIFSIKNITNICIGIWVSLLFCILFFSISKYFNVTKEEK